MDTKAGFGRALCALLFVAGVSLYPAEAGSSDVRSVDGEGSGCFGPALSNGGFELSDAGQDRPPFWYLGFEDEPLPGDAGTWALDEQVVAEGRRSLRLEPGQGMAVSQILHLPTGLLAGKTVSFQLWVRYERVGEPPVVIVAALNPTVTEPHPALGPGVAGAVVVVADDGEGEWHRYGGSFQATAPSNLVFAYLSAPGTTGAVWFDGMEISTDEWLPQPDPVPPAVGPRVSERAFDLGFTTEGPPDLSELGRRCLMSTAAETADLANVFFAVRWCRLGGDTCAEDRGHALDLERVALARSLGLRVVLTFDFTHGQPEDAGTIGDLNPRPDGTSPGTLLDPAVRTALVDELLWLVGQAAPDVVIVGIEVDIMGERHPEWWPAFVSIQHAVYDAVKARRAATHVTAYHRINWSVDDAGRLIPSAAATWRQLLGAIDSIAYSVYPNTAIPGLPVASFPGGYFARPGDIAPDLPIVIPEFGMPAGHASGISQQEQVAALDRIVSELIPRNLSALIWFQLNDRLYLDAPRWAQLAFDELGLRDLAGASKQAFLYWRELHELPRSPRFRRPRRRLFADR